MSRERNHHYLPEFHLKRFAIGPRREIGVREQGRLAQLAAIRPGATGAAPGNSTTYPRGLPQEGPAVLDEGQEARRRAVAVARRSERRAAAR